MHRLITIGEAAEEHVTIARLENGRVERRAEVQIDVVLEPARHFLGCARVAGHAMRDEREQELIVDPVVETPRHAPGTRRRAQHDQRRRRLGRSIVLPIAAAASR